MSGGLLDGLHVLFVDDRADEREPFSHALGVHGATVVTANDVEEALVKLERDRPEIVITASDGRYVVSRARAEWDGQGDRVFAVGDGLDGDLCTVLSDSVHATDLVSLVARLRHQIDETRDLRERVQRGRRERLRLGATTQTPAREAPATFRNRLLDSIPAREREWIAARVIYLNVDRRRTLYAAGMSISFAYFPCSAVLSLVSVTLSGKCVEVAAVGSDGFGGVPLVLGADSSPFWLRATIDGGVWRLRASDFGQALGECPSFRDALMRSAEMQFVETAQAATCNRVHSIESQVARWLLSTSERCGSSTIEITHDTIADLFGTRRASISVAVESLVRAGLVVCQRGRIEICDAAGLRAVSCECYEVLKQEYDRLLPAARAAR